MDINVYGLSLIPLIIGLVQLARYFGVPTKFLPLTSMLIGILLGIIYVAPNDFKKGVLIGIWLGLGATGMHSGVKNTIHGKMKK